MTPTPSSLSRTPAGRLSVAIAVAALLTAAVLGLAPATAMAEEGEKRRVPPEMVGAYCPPGGCPPPSGSGWHAAGFAAALGLIVALSRHQR